MSKQKLKPGQVWESKSGKQRFVSFISSDDRGRVRLDSVSIGMSAYIWWCASAAGGAPRRCYMGTWQDWSDGATLVGGEA
jgi:3-mercaptopyruvate sulfurtransferase SseA